MSEFNHVVLTRFNLPTAGAQEMIRAKDGWLRKRVNLFETFCLPAMRSQTSVDFHWIVYFDPSSPGWLRDRVTEYAESAILTPVYRETASTEEIASDIASVVESKAHYLLTTNLDNDDAVASDFVSRIQATSPTSCPMAIYLANGLIRSQGRLYSHRYERNAFNSVWAPWLEPVTCWSEWHTDFDQIMPVLQLDGPAAWMQIVHGSNVSNRVKGRRVAPGPYRGYFGPLIDDVAEPKPSEAFGDAVIGRPLRFIREAGRSAGKRLIVGSIGRDGLDRARVMGRKLFSPISRPQRD